MRVLWITRAAAPAGGAERHVADAAALLAARGVSSLLLHDPAVPADPAFTARFDGAFPAADVARQVRSLAPDVVYLHQVEGAALPAAVADSGVPGVRFFHDHAPFCLRRHKYTTLAHSTCTRPLGLHCWPCLGPLNRTDAWPGVEVVTLAAARRVLDANRRLAAFAVGSAYMKDHVVAHGFPPAAVRVLPLFVPPPDAPPPARREGRLLVFVGALLRGKGLDLLLRALPSLAVSIRLRVVGSGHQEAWLREEAARAGVADRVEWLGTLPRESLAAHLRQAACVVVPSREPETFGLVGLEAFRHGTPVVASRAGGVGEWLVEGRTGLSFPPGDVPALAAALARLLDDPAEARRMGLAGLDLLRERFTPERHADALLDLLRDAAGRSP